MSSSPEGLSREALDVLRNAEVPEPPSGVEDRVLSRLRTQLPPVPSRVLPSSPAPTPSPASALGRFGAALGVGSLAVGVAVGVTAHAVLVEPTVEVRTVTIEVPAKAPPVAVEAPVAAQTQAPVAPAPPPPKRAVAPVGQPEPSVPAPADLDLARERQLIEQARSALVRGEAKAAAETLAQHGARFPTGRMVEERESLWIQALIRQGDFSKARERAERFRSKFPQSLLLPVIEASLSTIPK